VKKEKPCVGDEERGNRWGWEERRQLRRFLKIH
jgi:hypothetical protein